MRSLRVADLGLVEAVYPGAPQIQEILDKIDQIIAKLASL